MPIKSTNQVNRSTDERFFLQIKIDKKGNVKQKWTINDREENNKVVVTIHRATLVKTILNALNKDFGYLE